MRSVRPNKIGDFEFLIPLLSYDLRWALPRVSIRRTLSLMAWRDHGFEESRIASKAQCKDGGGNRKGLLAEPAPNLGRAISTTGELAPKKWT